MAVVAWSALFLVGSKTPYGIYWLALTGPAVGFVTAGLVAWSRRPENRTGKLMTLAGFLFLVPTLASVTQAPLVWTFGSTFANVVFGVVAYLVLSYPRGVLTSRVARGLFWFALAILFALTFAGPWFFDPRDFGCTDCPEGVNLLLIKRDAELVVAITQVQAAFVIALVLALAAFMVGRFARATQPAKRALWPVYLPMTYFCLDHAYGVAVVNYFQGAIPDFSSTTTYVTAIVMTVVPLMFLLGLLRMRARRARVGELVVELGSTQPSIGLKDAIARALGDPAVEVGFWMPEFDRYVTADGKRLELPVSNERHAATLLEREGEPLAAIVHDVALLEDPTLVAAVAAAARLAVENERLTAIVKAQLEEVRASRHRIVEAADLERRKVERDLHDGAQQRLVRLGVTLRLAQNRLGSAPNPELDALLDEAAGELRTARDELRELSQGIHPAVLTQEGLRAAVESVAELSPVPTRVDVPAERFPPAVEATAYFVVAEALTNVAKHSHASRAAVSATVRNGTLTVEITDDGIGGVNEARGTGLRGLVDRVEALDGSLSVASGPATGTKVLAQIPCA